MPVPAALLTGDDVGRRLGAVVTGELLSWRTRSVDARRDGATASYVARVRGPGGERTAHLGATTRPLPGGPPSGGVHAWAWPDDPWLPGLGGACRPSGVAALLGPHVDPALLRLRVRTYRPGRRAVVEVAAATGRVFVKVMPPAVAATVAARHRLLAGVLPVAPLHACTDDGRLLLPALPGTPARFRLRAAGPLPSGTELVDLTGRLPHTLLRLPARPSWADGARDYGASVAVGLRAAGRRDDALRAERLAARVEARLADGSAEPEPAHGDLYEGQLLLDPAGRVSGLLDVDRAGPGRRADDLACLLAHLEVLAQLPGWPRTRLLARREQWRAAFLAVVDPDELAARTAGVLLSLATGPYRVQAAGWPAVTAARLGAAERALSVPL